MENGKILQLSILAYRESRGGEVRHANFLKQYQGASLQQDEQLNKTIDGISGATLSVRAVGAWQGWRYISIKLVANKPISKTA